MILLKVKDLTTCTTKNISLTGADEYLDKYVALIPVILTDEGEIIREAHNFLYEKHINSRNISSYRTVHTYAECLLIWFKYCISNSLNWKTSNVRSLLHYRNSMKSATGARNKSLRPKTINLRMTVVLEFFKYYLELTAINDSAPEQNHRLLLKSITKTRFNVRLSDSRPVALTTIACRSLCSTLKGVHRIIFIWGISTGLRISSTLKILLRDFESLRNRAGSGFLEVLSKGGKTQKIFLPKYLIDETNRYLDVERTLVVLRSKKRSQDAMYSTLFLNGDANEVTRGCYYAAYKRACASLAINSHPHQARTTFATYMEKALRAYGKENNIDHIKIIQGLLGHADSSTTMSYLETIATNSLDVLNLLEINSANIGINHG